MATRSAALPTLFWGGGDEVEADGTRFNPTVISFLEDDYVHKQMLSRESEYTEYRPIRLFCGTWNVNGKFPREDIGPWLTDGASAADGDACMPDLYVIGLQEMVDLSVSNVAMQTQCGKRSKEWCSLLEGVLNTASPRDAFELVGSRYLVGVLTAVYVKRKYRPFVSDVQDATAAVGFVGLMGNKGGAAVRFRLFDTTLCFVCAHLAAHRGAVEQRNSDFHGINTKIDFRGGDGEGNGKDGNGSSSHVGGVTVFDHDLLLWFGDFNYRIDEAVPTEKVFELANAGGPRELDQLRRADQLNIERGAGRVFSGFSEGPLSFRPTYKFQVGTSSYESRAEKKLRPPAWCDRILWRTAPSVTSRHWRQLYYGSVDSLITSDHKPVHALFELAVKTTIDERRAAVLGDIARRLGSWENSLRPRLELSAPSLYVRDVVYGVPLSRELILTNASDVVAPWRLVPKPEEKVLCKSWLHLEPPFGLLPPRSSVTLRVSVCVDDAVARDISLGRELAAGGGTVGVGAGGDVDNAGALAALDSACALLDDVLIVRAERGRDIYFSVSALVQPSAWGASLAQLARRPEPMRAAGLTAAASAVANASAGSGPATGVLGSAPPPAGAPPPPANDLTIGSRALAAMLAGDEQRNAPPDASPLASCDSSRKGGLVVAVPKEMWRLVDALISRPASLAAPGLFTSSGDNAEALAIREAIDTGDALPAGVSPLALGSALLSLVRSLRDPLIPTALFPSAPAELTAPAHHPAAVEAWTGTMLRALPPLHYNTLVYLVRFVREALAVSARSGEGGGGAGRSVEDVAYTLSRVIMRKHRHEEAPMHALQQGGGDGGDRAAADVAAVASSDFADPGTRWEPSVEEQEAMTAIATHLLTSAHLA